MKPSYLKKIGISNGKLCNTGNKLANEELVMIKNKTPFMFCTPS
jgi:hypothetical protein